MSDGMASIGDSLDRAATAVNEIEQALPDLPNPISTEREPAEPDDHEAKKIAGRKEALKKAFAKSKERDAERAKTAAERKAAEKDNSKFSPDWVKDNAIRKGIIEKRMSEHAADNITPKELNSKEMREFRKALSGRYPGAKLGEILDGFEHWEAEFRRDPVATREKIMAAYLKMSPQNYAEQKPAEYEQGIRGAVQRAQEDQADIEEMQPFIEKYGNKLPHIMRQLVAFDRDLAADPALTSARLAANYGAPATDLQAEEYSQQRQQEATSPQATTKPLHERTPDEDMASVVRAVELIVENRDHPSIGLPGIENESVQFAMADALERGLVTRTQDRMADLRAAYNIVMQEANSQRAQFEQQMQRGGKSINGAPSPGAVAARRGSGSTREALSNAAARM